VAESIPVWTELTVVVPTIGRALVADCLRAIAAGTVRPAEVVVVDQGEGAVTAEVIARVAATGLAVSHVRSSERGIAAGTNAGVERVQTAYVATTHDDCRVRSDWVAALRARLPAAGEAIVTGRVEPEGEGLVLTVVTHERRRVYARPMVDRDVLFPPNMAFPLDLARRIGSFDEHPSLRFAGEDNEWAYRALRAHVPIVYEPDVVVRHLAWQDERARTGLYRRYARGQGAFYGKYLRRGDAFIARRAARDLLRAPWWALRGAATRNRDLFAMGVGALTGLPVGLVWGLSNEGDRVRWFA
jgi:GT2 family glycosyltransferase